MYHDPCLINSSRVFSLTFKSSNLLFFYNFFIFTNKSLFHFFFIITSFSTQTHLIKNQNHVQCFHSFFKASHPIIFNLGWFHDLHHHLYHFTISVWTYHLILSLPPPLNYLIAFLFADVILSTQTHLNVHFCSMILEILSSFFSIKKEKKKNQVQRSLDYINQKLMNVK